MGALVLSAGRAALGGALFGPVGAMAGRIAGALAGNMLDRSLLGGGEARHSEGPRLADLNIMASTEGSPIPRVYGRARLSGQVIWATQLEEVITTREDETSGGKGFGAPPSTNTTYTYFANFAVGLCEGEIACVRRIWADGQPLDLTGVNFRVYRGDDDQTADALIVAKEGADNAPAYRGTAYIVFERLPLQNFGNRIPQLSFEIVRPVGRLERMVRAVTLIPGTTEFGYEPAPIVRALGPGQSAPENRHVFTSPSDVVASLDELQALCPNLERVALVVAWFGTDLRASHCEIKPGVDSAIKETVGASWSVAGLTRPDAYTVSQADGRPAYGGTPSDESVRNLIAEIRVRGLKVTLYPFVMMDVPADNALADPWTGASSQPPYPWRGRITCDPAPGQSGSPQGTSAAAAQVTAFFDGSAPDDWRYRKFILHYASLAVSAGGVDAFLIGSELKALTRVRSAPGVYPAVDHLVALAAEVKGILGSEAIVTYGADWTEYGADVVEADGSEVRFPLDPLWASPGIDVVGIDYYAPLADWRDEAGHLDLDIAATSYDLDYLARNVRGGEGYDWYYADQDARAAQERTAITDGTGKPWTFRVKDIWNWWANPHVERAGGVELSSPTAWVPQSKPIWITELGCPAVDKGANQPSVFPDPKSSESHAPYFSSGTRDDLIQRRSLEAFVNVFDPGFGDATQNPVSSVYGAPMLDISALHLWTWDARPYPVFPAAENIWSDGPNWQTGHWLTGRLGAAPLDGLVAAILGDCGIDHADTSGLRDVCEGYVIDRPMSPRAMIEPLASVYTFSAFADGGTLAFVQRGGAPVTEIGEDDLVLPPRGALERITRAQETELPRDISLGYTDALKDYRRAAAISRRLVGGSNRTQHADTAIVTYDAAAQRRAEIWLQDTWAGRERAEFAVGRGSLNLMPGDVAGVTINARRHLFEILDIVDTEQRAIKARSIDPDVFALAQGLPEAGSVQLPPAIGPAHVEVLDLPALDSSEPVVLTRLAVTAQPWPGSMVVWRSADGASFDAAQTAFAPSIVGETLDALAAGPTGLWDCANRFRVRLFGGSLSSTSEARVLGGINAAAMRHGSGNWEIVQFVNAALVGPRTYELSHLLRGQLGTEHAMAGLLPQGARFVLLDRHLVPVASGLDVLDRPMQLRLAASGKHHDDPAAVEFTVTPRSTALIPLAPVHVRARRDADGVRISWTRRTRIDGDGWAAEPPLGEAVESYVIDILDGSDLKRRLTAAIPQALYSAADELADFGAHQASLMLRIAQVSAVTGAGHPLETTVAVLS